jgi:hypothetical protein
MVLNVEKIPYLRPTGCAGVDDDPPRMSGGFPAEQTCSEECLRRASCQDNFEKARKAPKGGRVTR